MEKQSEFKATIRQSACMKAYRKGTSYVPLLYIESFRLSTMFFSQWRRVLSVLDLVITVQVPYTLPFAFPLPTAGAT